MVKQKESGAFSCDTTGRITWTSPEFDQIAGRALSQGSANTWFLLIDEAHREEALHRWLEAVKEMSHFHFAFTVSRAFSSAATQARTLIVEANFLEGMAGTPTIAAAVLRLAETEAQPPVAAVKKVSLLPPEVTTAYGAIIENEAQPLASTPDLPVTPDRLPTPRNRVPQASVPPACSLTPEKLQETIALACAQVKAAQDSELQTTFGATVASLEQAIKQVLGEQAAISTEKTSELRNALQIELDKIQKSLGDSQRSTRQDISLLSTKVQEVQDTLTETGKTVASQAGSLSQLHMQLGLFAEDLRKLFDVVSSVQKTLTQGLPPPNLPRSVETVAHFPPSKAEPTATTLVQPISLREVIEPIRMPLPTAQSAPSISPEPALQAKKLRIAIADDNETSRRAIVRLLEELGYEVGQAANGAEVFRLLKSHRYDAVLLECKMPIMDGFETALGIRATERRTGARTTLVGMSANVEADTEMRCTKAGMDSFLSKPIKRDKLVEVLDRCIAVDPVLSIRGS